MYVCIRYSALVVWILAWICHWRSAFWKVYCIEYRCLFWEDLRNDEPRLSRSLLLFTEGEDEVPASCAMNNDFKCDI